jgi:hypothetical protein
MEGLPRLIRVRNEALSRKIFPGVSADLPKSYLEIMMLTEADCLRFHAHNKDSPIMAKPIKLEFEHSQRYAAQKLTRDAIVRQEHHSRT